MLYRFLGPSPGNDRGGVPLGAFGLPLAAETNGQVLFLFFECEIDGIGTATHIQRYCDREEVAQCDFNISNCANCKKSLPSPPPKCCNQCHIPRYCDNNCRVAHWKSGHASECDYFIQQRDGAAGSAAGGAAGGAAGSAAGRASREYTTRSGRHTNAQDYKNPETIHSKKRKMNEFESPSQIKNSTKKSKIN